MALDKSIDSSTGTTLHETRENMVQAQEAWREDPLLALAGTLACEVTDIGERHDDYIGDTLLAELREDNGE